MSCVDLTAEMSTLLRELLAHPNIDPERLEQLRSTPEWETASAWGWLLPSGELSGIARSHAGPLPKGIV